MKVRRLSLCLLLSMPFLPALFANPFPGEGQGWRAGGVELAVNIPLIAQGDLPRGAGFELNFIIGMNDAIGFCGMNKDWKFFGLDYYHYFDPLNSANFMVPVKARLGYYFYYDESFWGGSLGAGPSAFLGSALSSGSELLARADLIADLAVFARAYYGSHVQFVPAASVSCISYFKDTTQ